MRRTLLSSLLISSLLTTNANALSIRGFNKLFNNSETVTTSYQPLKSKVFTVNGLVKKTTANLMVANLYMAEEVILKMTKAQFKHTIRIANGRLTSKDLMAAYTALITPYELEIKERVCTTVTTKELVANGTYVVTKLLWEDETLLQRVTVKSCN